MAKNFSVYPQQNLYLLLNRFHFEFLANNVLCVSREHRRKVSLIKIRLISIVKRDKSFIYRVAFSKTKKFKNKKQMMYKVAVRNNSEIVDDAQCFAVFTLQTSKVQGRQIVF